MALSLPVRPTLSQPSSAETPPKAAVQSARLCLLVVIGQAGFISSQELGLERAAPPPACFPSPAGPAFFADPVPGVG